MGSKIKLLGLLLGSAVAQRCSKGSAKAMVLPEPVREEASRSRPASVGGIAADWISVGCVKSSSSRAWSRAGHSDSDWKDIEVRAKGLGIAVYDAVALATNVLWLVLYKDGGIFRFALLGDALLDPVAA